MLLAVNMTSPVGVKAVALRCMWQHFGEKLSEMNICYWVFGFRCSNCIAFFFARSSESWFVINCCSTEDEKLMASE